MKFFQDYSIFESMTYKANFCAQCVIEVCVYFSCQLIHGLPARVRNQNLLQANPVCFLRSFR